MPIPVKKMDSYENITTLSDNDELLVVHDGITSNVTVEKVQKYVTNNINVQDEINTHDTSTIAHTDIRDLIGELTTRINTILDSDDETLDQLSEIVDYIQNNKDLIDAITASKVSVSDIVDNLASTDTNKPLSANQGKILTELITANVYTLPLATDTVRGGAKIGFTQVDKKYPVQLENEQMYVEVPWTEGSSEGCSSVSYSPAVTSGTEVGTITIDGIEYDIYTPTDTNTWKANTSSSDGYVLSGSGHANKAWMTDENGNPSWTEITADGIGAVPYTEDMENIVLVGGSGTETENAYLDADKLGGQLPSYYLNSSNISYNNTLSGLDASNMQDAVDEISTDLEATMTYSTEEKCIGKWINNKPLYRRCLSIPPISAGGVSAQNIADWSIDTVVNIGGYLQCTGSANMQCPLNFMANNEQKIYTFYNKANGDFDVFSIGYNVANGVAILEYTKTTDQ